MFDNRRSRYESLLALVVFLGAAFCLYAGSFGHAWTYDDFPVIVNNPDIRSLHDFLQDHYGGRPVREVTYLLDHALFGLNPAGYHVQNILWHGLNTFLLFLLVARIGGRRFVAWSAALIFLAHPLAVEVVANISHRKDSLALAFALAAMLAYQMVFRDRGRFNRAVWFLTALALAVIGYQAKQSAVALLPIALAYEWAFVPPADRLLARYRSVWAAAVLVGVGYGIFWYLTGGRQVYLLGAQFLFSKMSYYGPVNEAVYGLMLLKSWVFMFAKALLPVDLALEYAYPVPGSFFGAWPLAGAAMLIAYGFGLWLSWRRSRPAFFWLIWIGAFWAPVSNIWPLAYFAADRYLYAPLAGLAVLLGMALAAALRRLPWLAWGIVGACVAWLAVLSWQQDRIWRDELALWSQAVKVSPDAVYALNNLGAEYGNRGDLKTALQLIGKAAENPFYQEAQLNMARIYERFGQEERAAYYYRRARNPHAVSNP